MKSLWRIARGFYVGYSRRTQSNGSRAGESEAAMTLQVPMNEVAVTVALAGMDPVEHFIYLHPISEKREGPETLYDYLNGERAFFPMLAAGVPKMVNRDQILWVRFEKLPDLYESESTLIEKLTILELIDGSRLEGTVP